MKRPRGGATRGSAMTLGEIQVSGASTVTGTGGDAGRPALAADVASAVSTAGPGAGIEVQIRQPGQFVVGNPVSGEHQRFAFNEPDGARVLSRRVP